MNSRLPQSVILTGVRGRLKDFTKSYHLKKHIKADSHNYCRRMGTMKIVEHNKEEREVRVKCFICNKTDTIWYRYDGIKIVNNYVVGANFYKRHEQLIIFMIIFSIGLVFSLSLTALSTRADKNMAKRLEEADKTYIYKNGESAICDVHPANDLDTRTPVDCTVVTKTNVGYYSVKFVQPGGVEMTEEIRALDMRIK